MAKKPRKPLGPVLFISYADLTRRTGLSRYRIDKAVRFGIFDPPQLRGAQRGRMFNLANVEAAITHVGLDQIILRIAERASKRLPRRPKPKVGRPKPTRHHTKAKPDTPRRNGPSPRKRTNST